MRQVPMFEIAKYVACFIGKSSLPANGVVKATATRVDANGVASQPPADDIRIEATDVPGEYTVTWTPREPGKYTVGLKAGGSEINALEFNVGIKHGAFQMLESGSKSLVVDFL